MSKSPENELRRLVRQLRDELEWASRTGIEPRLEPVRVDPEVLEAAPEAPPLPVDAGRPAPPERAAEAAAAPVDDGPPPAFEPDPDEPADRQPVVPAVPPSQARRREASAGRPWERYLDDAPPGPSGAPRRPAGAAPVDREPPLLVQLGAARDLPHVRAILGDCTRCKLHRAGRRQIVFGVGNPQADLMFVGEGPGRHEDRQGEPFVGASGQLLTRILENGMGVRRGDVYIANIVKCRPPDDRDPEPDEVEACEPFLRAQIQQVRPRVIVALGKYAAQTLLRSNTAISRLRGRWHSYEGIDLMPTFHPAWVVRDPSPERKRPVWEDMQMVMQKLGWERRR